MPVRQPQKIISLILLGWLSLAVVVSVAGWFQGASAPLVAVTVWGLTGLSLFACWKIGPIKNWALTVPIRYLVLFHLTRFVGFYFLFLQRRGELPPAFGVAAGGGDIITAALAAIILVSFKGENWKLLLVWNCLGLADIVFVVVTALRIGLQNWPSMHALREWPLSLLPTFVVPLVIASHLLIFVRAHAASNTAG